MSDPNTQWYYAAGNEQKGPVAGELIRSMLSAGAVTPETLVWSPAMTGWQPLRDTPLAAPSPVAGGSFIPSPPTAPAGPMPYGSIPAGYGPTPYGQAPYGQAGGGAAPPLGFVEAVRVCFSKYATFKGRASRSEFWFFYLFTMIVIVAASAIDGSIMAGGASFSFITPLVGLAFFLPQLGAVVRRLHDTDRSGWMYWIIMIPFVGIIALLVFWCQRGTPGPNRFG